MQISELALPGCFCIQPPCFEDERGVFVKTFHAGIWQQNGLDKFKCVEEFYSLSKRGVIRGMHFQTPPHAHRKLVYCLQGAVHDVLLDLRKKSPSYGQSISIELSAENRKILYLPIGIAHGFQSLSDDSCMVYKTDSVYAPEHDMGIHILSFGHGWPLPVDERLMSQRDLKHVYIKDYISPF